MSRSLRIAEFMAERLNEHFTSGLVSAMVFLRKDLKTEIAAKVGKINGALIVIYYDGFRNADASGAMNLTVTRYYTVSIHTRPLLRDVVDLHAEDIAEEAAKALHAWEPDETLEGFVEITVNSCDVEPDQTLLIYQLEVQAISRL